MRSADCVRRWRTIFFLCLGVLAAIGVFYALAAFGIGIPCPVYWITGLQCPGCGNSRAALSLLRLDFASALRYNPLFLPQFLYLGWVFGLCCRSYLKGGRFSYRPPFPVLDWILLVLIIGWGIIRNLL